LPSLVLVFEVAAVRLLCFGDVHLGAGTDYGTAPYGPGSRLDDQARVLDRVRDVIEDESVEVVLFAGDAFHRRRPTPSEILAWRQFVDAVDENGRGIPIYAIDGNHDVVSAELPSALETVKPRAHYEVSRRPQRFSLDREVKLVTLPWTPPARLVASRNGGKRDAIHQDAAALLIETAASMRREIDCPAILLAHWAVSGASTPSGVPAEAFREPVLPLADLEGLGYQAIVLGHIHAPQILSPGKLVEDANGSHIVPNATPVFYVGSPNVIDFGEAGSAHGVWILDTEDWSTRFVLVEDRPFVTLDLDAESLAVEDRYSAITDWSGAVVRVRYTATPEQAARVDHAKIRAALLEAGASKVYAIQPTIIRADRARVAGVDENLDATEAMRLWLESQGIDGARAKELQERGQRFLEEVRA
jgi:DNA repair exonuclease SbcCD nuclease subunit